MSAVIDLGTKPLNQKQIAAALGKNPRTIARAVKRGKFPLHDICLSDHPTRGEKLWLPEALVEYLDKRRKLSADATRNRAARRKRTIGKRFAKVSR
jgi:hypothetical protein